MSKIFIIVDGDEYILKSEADRAHEVLADRLRDVRKDWESQGEKIISLMNKCERLQNEINALKSDC